MNSKAKGKRGELELVDQLRAVGYPARRGVQYSGGADSPDIVGGPDGWHIECKRTEKLAIRDAVAQAENDAAGKPWAICHRWSGGEWLAIVRLSDWLRLVGAAGKSGDHPGGD